MKLKIVGHRFERSKQERVWNSFNVAGYEKMGYQRKALLNDEGGYLMVKPCRAIVIFETETKEHLEFDLREDILRFYGLRNLRIERFDRFLNEVYAGKVKIEIRGEKLHIVKA